MIQKKNEPEEAGIEYIPERPEEENKPAGHAPEAGKTSGTTEGGEETAKDHPRDEHEAGDVAHLKSKLKKKDAEIHKLRKEKEELRDQFLRKLAEMENMRKRLEREKAEYLQFALNDFLLELLDVLDNFERALSIPENASDGKTFREGVELIYRMYLNLLAKKGVQAIEIKDGVFDPSLHHAMATEESENVQEPQVGEELQKGYMLNNRLLRPAMVKVVVPKKG
jgi:molecular chaperone GrpE